jgi:FlaA1/EpsC-like NDP-sugar epimerase
VTSTLENIDWHSFLGRRPFPSPSRHTLDFVASQPILITGAGGSIGTALALRLHSAGPSLTLLDSSESSLFDLQSNFTVLGRAPLFYLGNAGDNHLLEEVFARHHPRLVFHCAAFKHVPLLETQPFAAITNNIFATRTLVSVASEFNARAVFLSTDKAVAPASLMGATKRVAEQIVLASCGTVLRLGNVVASRGSVAEVFARQIAAGSPLTVTDPGACRYFLTINEAVDLLLASAAEPDPSTRFIPDLRLAHYIADLARFMARTLAPDRETLIEFTSLRAGDKESETLFAPDESPRLPLTSGLVPINSPGIAPDPLHDLLGALRRSCESRDLPSAVSILRELVPDYKPSLALEALLAAVEPPVNNA